MIPKAFKLDYIHIVFLCVGIVLGYILGSFLPISDFFNFKLDQKSINIDEVKGNAVSDTKSEGLESHIVPCDLQVEVAGAVNRPGVYCFTQGSIVNEALLRSDGLNRLAAQRYVAQRINLSEKLTGNQKIYFPYEDDLKCEVIPFIADSKLDNYLNGGQSKGCISINSASKKDLQTLKGIGEVTAGKIIDGRPYTKVDELESRAILSEKLFSELVEGICL